MKSTFQIAATLVAALLSDSASAAAVLKNTLKAPNDRYVLNARQALIAADAASVKAAADEYDHTLTCCKHILIGGTTLQCSIHNRCLRSLRLSYRHRAYG